MMWSALYKTNMLSWIFFIVLAPWNNSPRIDMSSWFRTNQSLLFLLIAACSAGKQQIHKLYSLGLIRPTIYRTRGEYSNHYNTGAIS
jgi:hypothetical protein